MVARTLTGTAALVLLAIASPLQAEPRAVIELFTSQGCSSCPPADKLIGELAADPAILAMSLAIDYWDYLGWKDTLALPGHTRRQKAYASARHDREVYTPQAVVNGTAHVLGSDKAAIERAMAESKTAEALALPVTLTVKPNEFVVTVPAGPAETGEVWLCPITKAVTVEIGRGENSGRTITYHNVVRQWIKVGDWTGKGETWHVPLSKMTAAKVDRVAVVVQRGAAVNPGLMLGATMASLK
jgi:hypothetical protein